MVLLIIIPFYGAILDNQCIVIQWIIIFINIALGNKLKYLVAKLHLLIIVILNSHDGRLTIVSHDDYDDGCSSSTVLIMIVMVIHQ